MSRFVFRIFAFVMLFGIIFLAGCSSTTTVNQVPLQPPVNRIPLMTGNSVIPPFSEESQVISREWKNLLSIEHPQVFENETIEYKGIKGIFIKGVPYKGKETRVFAWVGIPQIPGEKKVPALVLVHGADACADLDWVSYVNSKGYAAISMDLYGNIPVKENDKYKMVKNPIADSWPRGTGGFAQMNDSDSNNWNFHAVAGTILAHSIIRSMPGVDKERIGIVGVSFGGYVSCITAAIDERFKFCVPVFGCGFFDDETKWTRKITKVMGEKGVQWLKRWDASLYLPNLKIPSLWLTGLNDPYYSLQSFQKSLSLLPYGNLTLSYKIDLGHGLLVAYQCPEIYAFADSFFKNQPPLPVILDTGKNSDKAWVKFKSFQPLHKAFIQFTKDTGLWKERVWKARSASIDSVNGEVSALIPEGTAVYFFALIDQSGNVSTSPYIEL